jgi:hypothetical protein
MHPCLIGVIFKAVGDNNLICGMRTARNPKAIDLPEASRIVTPSSRAGLAMSHLDALPLCKRRRRVHGWLSNVELIEHSTNVCRITLSLVRRWNFPHAIIASKYRHCDRAFSAVIRMCTLETNLLYPPSARTVINGKIAVCPCVPSCGRRLRIKVQHPLLSSFAFAVRAAIFERLSAVS